jgi:glycosyltransferase involved in cell wall biosynthesis
MILRKGVDLLITAFSRLVGKGYDVELLLVGREAELPAFLAPIRPDVRARIRYEGFQPPEKLPQFFSRCDVFVLPSRHDGWGVVINQACGAGLPIISSDAVGAGLDLVESGVNGSIFSAGDVAGLENCMELFANHPDMARRWGEASREMALTVTPAAGAEKWVKAFKGLAENYENTFS